MVNSQYADHCWISIPWAATCRSGLICLTKKSTLSGRLTVTASDRWRRSSQFACCRHVNSPCMRRLYVYSAGVFAQHLKVTPRTAPSIVKSAREMPRPELSIIYHCSVKPPVRCLITCPGTRLCCNWMPPILPAKNFLNSSKNVMKRGGMTLSGRYWPRTCCSSIMKNCKQSFKIILA